MKKAAAYFATTVAAVATLSLAACGDSTEPAANLFNDSTTTLDVAASAGDAMATSVTTMMQGDTVGGSSADYIESSASLATDPTNNINVTRTRTCLDANNAVLANCLPVASIKKVIVQASVSGSRSSTRTTTGGTSATWTGSVHRSALDTVTRGFATGTATENSRTHSGNGTANDTTTFTDGTITRLMAESAHDTVKTLVFNLPHSSNPYPASGSIVRAVTVHVAITAGERSFSKDVSRTVSVAFPADAQGNVVLTVNTKTCNLNLVTHVVSACH